MIILGLNFGHDAGACVVRDGEVLSITLRERVSRVKKAKGLDRETVDICLAEAGHEIEDVDFIALATSQGYPFAFLDPKFRVIPGPTPAHPNSGLTWEFARKRHNLLLSDVKTPIQNYVTGGSSPSDIGYFPPFDQFHYADDWLSEGTLEEISQLDIAKFIEKNHTDHMYLPVSVEVLGVKKPGYLVNHHFAHAAGAFFFSGREEAPILTIDGASIPNGYYPGMYFYGRGNQILPLAPHHVIIGRFYDIVASLLGLGILSGAGKLMGLAPYGDPLFRNEGFVGNWRDIVRKQGIFLSDALLEPRRALQQSWHAYCRFEATNRKLDISALGDPDRITETLPAGMASSAQWILERTIIRMLETFSAMLRSVGLPTDTLVYSGGVALNVVANQRISRETEFKNLFVPPNCDDMGISVGAALAVNNAILGGKSRPIDRIQQAYFGRAYSTDQVRKVLREYGDAIVWDESGDTAEYAARDLASGSIIAWFEGRSETGPRALGHRSILADPRHPETWEKVNRLKGRELWRPLAPSVLLEETSKFFTDIPEDAPYMGVNATVATTTVPAVTHLDGTARIQTVEKSVGRYHDLIQAFGKLTGTSVVLNTSFNGPDIPIVDTPREAVDFLLSNQLDVLYLEGIRVTRNVAI